jgi:hypothetical protein
MLEGALGEILAARNVVHARPALDERAAHAPLGEIDSEANAHRAAADDDDMTALAHVSGPIIVDVA